MNIDTKLFYKLQKEAINDAKERCSYYEGFIQGMYKAETIIMRSRNDINADCNADKDDPLRNQKLRINYTPNKED